MQMPARSGEQQPRPPGLPGWPHWALIEAGRSCIVTGRHLTPGRARLVQFLAALSTLGVLALPVRLWWGFQVPDVLREAVNAGGTMFGYSLDFRQRKWIYAGLWLCCWIFWRLWEWPFRVVYRAVLARRTTVRFTARHITLARGITRRAQHYDRQTAEIMFPVTPHPNLAWLEMKARQRGLRGARLAVFYEQIRFLFMQYGLALIPVARFTSPEDAQRFSAVCQFANDYPLSKSADDPVPHHKPKSEVANAPDI